MQKVTLTLAVDGIDPTVSDVEALMQDLVADHLHISGKDGYRVLLLTAEWDQNTIEFHAAQMQAQLRAVKALETKCYASKPPRRQALEMNEEAKALEDACETLMKKDDVKKSVDLTTVGIEVIRRCTAISEHLITIAHPSRKEEP